MRFTVASLLLSFVFTFLVSFKMVMETLNFTNMSNYAPHELKQHGPRTELFNFSKRLKSLGTYNCTLMRPLIFNRPDKITSFASHKFQFSNYYYYCYYMLLITTSSWFSISELEICVVLFVFSTTLITSTYNGGSHRAINFAAHQSNSFLKKKKNNHNVYIKRENVKVFFCCVEIEYIYMKYANGLR